MYRKYCYNIELAGTRKQNSIDHMSAPIVSIRLHAEFNLAISRVQQQNVTYYF